ncbi:MAG: hypothetical protein WA177_08315 [Xanthobacteraceae bacterium]
MRYLARRYLARRYLARRDLARYGFWTCAAIYAAIGVAGVVFFSSQPKAASFTEGYGTIRLAAQR